MLKQFPPSELIINEDGSVFHLHVRPEQLASRVILVGDPGRVAMVASFFDEGSIECDITSREFHTITGKYKGKRITCISTGIGTDNIDIVMNEIDALVNINFKTRKEKPVIQSLDIVRIGTCGALQPDIKIGTFLASEKNIGFDGVLDFYAGRDKIGDPEFEEALMRKVTLNPKGARPYVTHPNSELLNRIACNDMERGCTISANGFYGPQGRVLRCDIYNPNINDQLADFRYQDYRITNYEMEGSAISGLALLMGHKALTVCCVIAQRSARKANTDYKPRISELIQTVLERI
ncbi:MAG: nucleoside phosphorylase [Paludibacteraceae bacterium]|nr:nucleoside phosphorylase [Paludibacteraceae bacterium]